MNKVNKKVEIPQLAWVLGEGRREVLSREHWETSDKKKHPLNRDWLRIEFWWVWLLDNSYHRCQLEIISGGHSVVPDWWASDNYLSYYYFMVSHPMTYKTTINNYLVLLLHVLTTYYYFILSQEIFHICMPRYPFWGGHSGQCFRAQIFLIMGPCPLSPAPFSPNDAYDSY